MTLTVRALDNKRTLGLALIALSFLGCAPTHRGFERFNPPPGPAREALVAVLNAWRDGQSPETGVGPKGDVHVVDKGRKSGQRLIGYEILGEVSVEKGRGYAVRLTLKEPDETTVVRFLVIGESPLWVWRQEDFEMMAHWMHPMDEENPQPKERPASSPKTP